MRAVDLDHQELLELDPVDTVQSISYLDEIRIMVRRGPKDADRPPDRASPGRGVSERDATGDLSRLAKALGHPARVHILELLLAKNSCVAGELADELPLAASTVSQHLKILKEAGLIKGEVDGPRRCYCVDRSMLTHLKKLIRAL